MWEAFHELSRFFMIYKVMQIIVNTVISKINVLCPAGLL
jgi:hypothetical protein